MKRCARTDRSIDAPIGAQIDALIESAPSATLP
jgi:hypothetical protein